MYLKCREGILFLPAIDCEDDSHVDAEDCEQDVDAGESIGESGSPLEVESSSKFTTSVQSLLVIAAMLH